MVGDVIRQRLSHGDLEALPLWSYPGKIIFPRDGEEVRRAVEVILAEEYVGFDTEARPAFRKGQHYDPSVVQMATGELAYVFQLSACGGLKPLLPLLERENLKKVCIGVREDVRRLQKLQKFDGRGFLELTDYTYPLGIRDGGLRKLAANLLGVRISKKEQTSNWARAEMSERQLRYAATDAWVSRKIYEAALDLAARGIRASAEEISEKIFEKPLDDPAAHPRNPGIA
jgi:ribonuclease D